ncbi:MAG: hypothetical protein EOP02_00940 [Proteobacteria bacterium]|nr:MAG: hypothetical protein EOP02_00940 [Pseudomonadota bacterium]
MADTRRHPEYPGMPFAEAVLRKALEDVLGAVDQCMAGSGRDDVEGFEAVLVASATAAAMDALLQLIPADLAEAYAEGIARSLIASKRRTYGLGRGGWDQAKQAVQ